MTEFTVKIIQRPFGIRFAHLDDNLVVIEEIRANSMADKLGMEMGDILVAINGFSVLGQKSSSVLSKFRLQKCPFHCTFERWDQHQAYNSDGNISETDTETDDIATFNVDALTSSNKHQQIMDAYDNNDEYDIDYDGDDDSIIFHMIDSNVTPGAKVKDCDDLKVFIPDGYNHDEFVYMDDPIEHQLATSYDAIDDDTKLVVAGYIRRIMGNMSVTSTLCGDDETNNANQLISKYLFNDTVMFDQTDTFNDQVMMLSNNGFFYGIHEWQIKIKKGDEYLQEIGVVSNDEMKNFMLEDGGVKCTANMGARAVYTNCSFYGTNTYASFNDDNSKRCEKDLSKLAIHEEGWSEGDVIRVVLNLRKGHIRFFLNGQKVRKVISLQKEKVYFPFIAYTGDCEYELIHFS